MQAEENKKELIRKEERYVHSKRCVHELVNIEQLY